MSDLVERLREPIIADAFESRAIQSGKLADRLIRERLDAADRIDTLEAENRALREALSAMLHAVCHETGFAAAVRSHTGLAFPWESLDLAEDRARALLAKGYGK